MHLVHAGLLNGKSIYGCRRGRMQEYAAEGMDIGKVAQIKSIATVEQNIDLSRHEIRQSQAGKLSVKAMDM